MKGAGSWQGRIRQGAMWVVRLAMGGVFLAAGALKIGDPAAFAAAIGNYQLFPALAPFVAAALPTTEIVAGAAVLAAPSSWRRAAAACLAALMAVFTVASVSALMRGIDVSCGCFGAGGGPVGWLTLARNGVLLAAALALVLWDTERTDAPSRAPI